MEKRRFVVRGFLALERIFRGSPLRNIQESALIEAQRTVFRELHRRFVERAEHGKRGLPAALDALDSIWASVRNLSEAAPFVVETLSTQQEGLRLHLQDFYQESTKLLEDGIRTVFAHELDQLSIPPPRMAKIIRIFLEGLLVELAQTQTEEQLEQLDQAYADMRKLFSRFAITVPETEDPIDAPDIALPW